MLKNPDGPLPGMKALRAFVAAARHANFTRAGEELGIRQPAISRYIAELEKEIGIRLFERSRRAARLTPAGEAYQRGVAVGLDRIAAAGVLASDLAGDPKVMIACGGSTSEMFLRPRLGALQRAVGGDATVRLLHCEDDYLDVPNVTRVDRIDLVASYRDVDGAPEDEVAVFPEAMAPVCSPWFASAHADVLRGPVADWGTLPFLEFARPSLGWATWEDWFAAAGRPQPPPRREASDDYAYTISAAVAGQGLALGWRNFVGGLLDGGLLVLAAGGFIGTARPFAVRLTEHGLERPVARRCLDAFRAIADSDKLSRRDAHAPGSSG